MRHILFVLIFTLLASCGQPVCFVGFGDCEKMFSNVTTSTSNSGTLPINSGSQTTFRISADHPTFTTSGGNGNYTWSVKSGSCGTFPTPTTGSFNLTTASSLCVIQVQDSTAPTANYGTLNIIVNP